MLLFQAVSYAFITHVAIWFMFSSIDMDPCSLYIELVWFPISCLFSAGVTPPINSTEENTVSLVLTRKGLQQHFKFIHEKKENYSICTVHVSIGNTLTNNAVTVFFLGRRGGPKRSVVIVHGTLIRKLKHEQTTKQ